MDRERPFLFFIRELLNESDYNLLKSQSTKDILYYLKGYYGNDYDLLLFGQIKCSYCLIYPGKHRIYMNCGCFDICDYCYYNKCNIIGFYCTNCMKYSIEDI